MVLFANTGDSLQTGVLGTTDGTIQRIDWGIEPDRVFAADMPAQAATGRWARRA